MRSSLQFLVARLVLFLLAHGAWSSPGITDALLVDSLGQPDPCIFFDTASSTYYCYADNRRFASSTHINSSWKAQPNYTLVTSTGDAWQRGIGAPSVAYLNGKYVMYFSEGEKILVAVSSAPSGPFQVQGSALLSPAPQPSTASGKKAFPAAPAIFQHAGNNYVLYKYGRAADYNGVSSICIREISADGLTATGTPSQLFTVTNGQLEDGRQWSEDEGPNMVYSNGLFYLFFNAGTWCAADYQVVYATSDTLLPTQSTYQYQGVFLETSPPSYDGVTLNAPGGISFVNPNTFIFMSYQPNAKLSCSQTSTGPPPPRYIHAGQLQYNGNGTVSVAAMWSA